MTPLTSSQFQIVNTGKVTREDRERAWDELQRAAQEKKTRPFYRAVDKHGLMYAGIIFIHSFQLICFSGCPFLHASFLFYLVLSLLFVLPLIQSHCFACGTV